MMHLGGSLNVSKASIKCLINAVTEQVEPVGM
jgi:hypothetical protein